MHLPTHLVLSWLVASAGRFERRDRMLVTLAGIAPDVDGLVVVVDWATRGSAHPTQWWDAYHHVAGHNLVLALAAAGACCAFARRRAPTVAAALVAFHLHVLCDYVGARGPDGFTWPIQYLFPFSTAEIPPWTGQWAINAWPNLVVTAGALALTLFLAWRRGYSPVELISRRVDAAVVGALRARFGDPSAAGSDQDAN